MAERLQAAFPVGQDLAKGSQLIDGEDVAFVVKAPANGPAPRLEGMVTRQLGKDFQAVGDSGLWAIVLEIPSNTKFAYKITIEGERVSGGSVEMPDWAYPPNLPSARAKITASSSPWPSEARSSITTAPAGFMCPPLTIPPSLRH